MSQVLKYFFHVSDISPPAPKIIAPKNPNKTINPGPQFPYCTKHHQPNLAKLGSQQNLPCFSTSLGEIILF